MSAAALIHLLFVVVLLAVLVPVTGRYLAAVYGGDAVRGDRVFAPVERLVYRSCGIDASSEQRWTGYLRSLLAFSVVGFGVLYLILRLQGALPGNPVHLGAAPAPLAFNTAVSFVTNTNWQTYGGEVTMSHLTQMVGLTAQNFVSAAAGMAVGVAIIRGVARARSATIGNFWVDLTRTLTRVLVPMAVVGAVLLVLTGVVQNLSGHTIVTTLEGRTQEVPGGPAASQVSIKQLGTNGGGFFNVNSAHPFENPSPWSNLIEMVMILLIPLSLPVAYGRLVGDRRQGRVLLAVMVGILLAATAVAALAESSGNPALTAVGVDQSISAEQGAHGLSEVLYAFGSGGNNNGSAFAGFGADTPWFSGAIGVAMLVGRFFLIIPALALAGSLAAKPKVPESAGTFPTHGPLFGGLVAGVVLIVAGLTFFPALALGPIVEQLSVSSMP